MKVSLINWHMVPQNTPLGAVPCAGLDAAYEGLINSGHDVSRTAFKINGLEKKVLCWGWRKQVAQVLRAAGKEVIVVELGYIGDRRKYMSIGLNGLNNYAKFPEFPDDGGKRFRQHGGIIKPWKKTGNYILILGQVKGDASLKGMNIMPWYLRMAKMAKEIYGLPVYFRPHPESVRRRGYEKLQGYSNIGGTLEQAINGALFTIAYNSNSCLDSVLSGVPCYAGDKGTMAWDLCMKNIGELYYPEREKIAHKIAWNQWSLDEIRQGIPFKAIIN